MVPSGLHKGNIVSITSSARVGRGKLYKKSIPDQGVDLDNVDLVELLESLLDLGLVRLDVDQEDQGVVLLNLLHRTLGVERVDDDLVLVQTGGVRDRLAQVLGRARELQGLGAVEAGRGPDLALLVGVILGCCVSKWMIMTMAITAFELWLQTYTTESSLRSSVGLLQALGLSAAYVHKLRISNRSVDRTELAKSAAA